MIKIIQPQTFQAAQEIFTQVAPTDLTFTELPAVRHAFCHEHGFESLFIVDADTDGLVSGLLPLQFNTDKHQYEWWGGRFTECSRLYVDPKLSSLESQALKLELLKAAYQLPAPIFLGEMIFDSDLEGMLIEHDDRYLLDVIKFDTWEKYLQRFSSKKRKNLNREMRGFERQRVSFIQDKSLFPQLVEWNIKTFINRGDSSFLDERWEKSHLAIVNNEELNMQVVGVKYDQELMGVFLGVKHRESFVVINMGANLELFAQVRLYLRRCELEYVYQLAKTEVITILDYMTAGGRGPGYEYKRNLHFDLTPIYRLDNDSLRKKKINS